MRLDRNNPPVYFGRPGSLLQFPWPRGDIDKTYDRPRFDFATGSGLHLVSSTTMGSRPFALNWNALHVDNYAKLEQYHTGMMGVGPWVFIDPSQNNMLTQNQSSATGLYNNTREWSLTNVAPGYGQISSNMDANFVHRAGARRSLRWTWPVTASVNPILRANPPYRNWWGYPVVPGLSYAWSAWITPDGVVDSSITVAIKLTWLNASGGTVSEISGGDIATTAWTRHSVVGVAPVGAVYCRPIFVVTGATVTVGGSLYIDEPLLEQDTVVNDWAPGTGLRPVEILSLADSVNFAGRFRKGVTMVVRELAP